ncbi:MAG: HAMP domain-containing histidine kinase [Clostridia bacterium]|nr:HAMP domain-containing histidine kinase [Clostridia bacterium]
MKKDVLLAIWRFVNRALVFFLLIAFVTTCCMMLFMQTVMAETGIEFTNAHIELAAKLTFLNVLLITLTCTVIDTVKRRFTVTLPIKRISEAAQAMIDGDFSVRIKHIGGFGRYDGFNEIIDCINMIAKELGGIETLRSDFISSVSHELKTPLAIIKNYAAMLEKDILSEAEKKEYISKISQSCDRLGSLVSNILKLNKLENQQLFLKADEYELGEQICECFLGFEEIFEEKSLDIETDIADGIIVKSDPELLALVWNNLFSNAVKFTDNGGKISVSLKSDGDYAVVSVSDTGCGISGETGKHIFDKFYQGDNSHSQNGNGLGLALVKRVIDITGAEISVESKINEGSCFTVRLKKEK